MYYTILRTERNKNGELTVSRHLESGALFKTKEECYKEIKRMTSIYEKYDYAKIDIIENDRAIITKYGIIIEFYIYEMFVIE